MVRLQACRVRPQACISVRHLARKDPPGLGFGFGVWGAGCRVQGVGCRVQGAGYRGQGAGGRLQGSGLRIQGVGFRVGQVSGLGVVTAVLCWIFGVWVQGFGLRW